MSRYDDRAQHGAAYLDRTVPGWRDSVKVDHLNLLSEHDCVLGQVYDYRRGATFRSGYDYFCSSMTMNPFWQRSHGFLVVRWLPFLGFSRSLARQEAAWKRVIHPPAPITRQISREPAIEREMARNAH